MGLFGQKKLKVKSFYNTKSRKIDIKGLNADLPSKFDFGLGSLTLDTQFQEASEKLKHLDLIQCSLSNDINGITDKKKRDELLEEIIKTKTKMLEIVSEVNNQQISQDNSKTNYSAEKKLIQFNFSSDYRADIVSVTNALHRIPFYSAGDFDADKKSSNAYNNISGINDTDFKINWSSQIVTGIEYCKKIYEEAQNHLDSQSLFYNKPSESILSIITEYPRLIKEIEFTIEKAHSRIIPLIKGKSERCGILGNIDTLSNYLTYCNVRALRNTLHLLSHELIKETIFYYKNLDYKFPDYLFSVDGIKRYVFNLNSELDGSSLYYLPDINKNNIANSKYGFYIVGNKNDFSNKKFTSDFYDKVFIPQIEYQLMGMEDIVLYDFNSKIFFK